MFHFVNNNQMCLALIKLNHFLVAFWTSLASFLGKLLGTLHNGLFIQWRNTSVPSTRWPSVLWLSKYWHPRVGLETSKKHQVQLLSIWRTMLGFLSDMKQCSQHPLFASATYFLADGHALLYTLSCLQVNHSTSSNPTPTTNLQSLSHVCLKSPRESSHYHTKIWPVNQRGNCVILGLEIKWDGARIWKRGKERQQRVSLRTSICYREMLAFSGRRGCGKPCSLGLHCLRISTFFFLIS